MKVGIQGTKNFNDYSVFLRAIGNVLRSIKEDDKELIIFSAGPLTINQFALEFVNVSERSLKARGIKTKIVKVPPSWFRTNIKEISYFAFFSKPKETVSDIVTLAESKDIEVWVYRY
jgi:hypothetical protein